MSLLFHLVLNAGLIVLGVLAYSYAYQASRPRPGGWSLQAGWRGVVSGVAFGVTAMVLMLDRVPVAPGIVIDARNVPVALVTLFEGWIPGLIAALIASAYRWRLGGAGVVPGVLVVFATVGAGALVRGWARCNGRVRPRHAFALSGLVFLLSISLLVVVLGDRGVEMVGRLWAPFLAAYAGGIGLTARLLHDVQERERLLAELGRFRAVLEDASDAIRIVEADTFRIVEVNRTTCELFGFAREELIGRDVREFWPAAPELRAPAEAALAETLAQGRGRSFGLGFPSSWLAGYADDLARFPGLRARNPFATA